MAARYAFVANLLTLLACGGTIPTVTPGAAQSETGSSSATQAEATSPRTAPGPTVASANCQAAGHPVENGVRRLQLGETGRRVWVYQHCTRYLPGLILVPPAGSNLLSGMNLSEGDTPEHLPYARAGFTVVSFDIAGALEGNSEDAFVEAMTTFIQDDAGLGSARRALVQAYQAIPDLQSLPVFVAGHSSAGTLALLFAASDPRVQGVAAFAPVPDLTRRFADMVEADPQMEALFTAMSPAHHAPALSGRPVFVFHSPDDRLPIDDSEYFFRIITPAHPANRFETGPGDHYRSMIEYGVPRAVAWFQQLIHSDNEAALEAP